MKRTLLRAVLVAVAAAGLPGCVFSLFSDHTPMLDDDDRIEELEGRMDEIERRLPPPPPTPPSPPPK